VLGVHLSNWIHVKETYTRRRRRRRSNIARTNEKRTERGYEFEWVSVDDVFHDVGVLFETDYYLFVSDMHPSVVSVVYYRA
tara:strand:+ start:1166 stop:1408 length:243 start_codon:yes stop_codon:yes gene_type:complete